MDNTRTTATNQASSAAKPARNIASSHIQQQSPLIQLALGYKRRGFQPLPIPRQGNGERNDGKNPAYQEWEKFSCSIEEIANAFNLDQLRRCGPRIWQRATSVNIGLQLGSLSNGLVDIDLDSPEAIKAAPFLLPATGMIHGRLSKPRSHYWYMCPTAGKTIKRIDPESRDSIIELRCTGQTVVPPSVHLSGERLAWEAQQDPAEVEELPLLAAVDQVAAAATIAQRWKEGGRDSLAMHLAGGLAHGGYDETAALSFIAAICCAAEDEEDYARSRVVRDTYARFHKGEQVTGFPALSKLLGEKVVAAVRGWLNLPSGSGVNAAGGISAKRGGRGSDATALFQMADARIKRYFTDQDGVPHIQLNSGEPLSSCEVQSEQLKAFLRKLYFEQSGAVVGTTALSAALDQLKATALNTGAREAVWVRLAHQDSKIYLDLANAEHEAVEIDVDGWNVITDPPVVFRRNPHLLSLPRPVRDGSLSELRRFINVSDADWPLLVGCCCMCFHATGPYPILVLNGEQGTAKTTTTKVLKRLLDPTGAEVRTQPDKDQSVMIAARNDWLLAYDNLSKIDPWLSDMLCVLSTGGSYACRKLYTNGEESCLKAKRPVVLNGIVDLVRRPDLADRMIKIVLEPISDDMRRLEAQFWDEFDKALPRILGALLDAIVGGLRNLPDVELARQPRMADFAQWAVACEVPAGLVSGSFMAAYADNRTCASYSSIEDNQIAQLISGWIHTLTAHWRGTATELLSALRFTFGAQTPEWLKPRDIGKAMRAYAPNFRQSGIVAHERLLNGKAVWEIARPVADS